MLLRSVFMAPDGLPLSQFGSYDADDRTPFRRRWGGWYVTGTHGSMRHIGNAIVTDKEKRETIVSDSTLHPLSLESVFDARGYVSAHSDIAALMVFGHQGHMMNLITRVGWRPGSRYTIGSSRRAAARRHQRAVDYLLFVDEEPLTAAISVRRFCRDVRGARPGRQSGSIVAATRSRTSSAAVSLQLHGLLGGIWRLANRRAGAIYGRMGGSPRGAIRARYARLSETDRCAVVEILPKR
jgi:hypothetical protein